jgi:hypothetical protein
MTQPAPIEVSVRLDAALLEAATAAFHAPPGAQRRGLVPGWRAVAAWTALFLISLTVFRYMGNPLPLLAGLLIGAVVALGFYLWVTRRMTQDLTARLDALHAVNGPSHIVFDATGFTTSGRHDRGFIGWPLIGPAQPFPGGTMMSYGTSLLVIPDVALPQGLTPAAFRDRLSTWRAAHLQGLPR